MKILKYGKYLRGTILDPFFFSKERVQERKLIKEYEKDINLVLEKYNSSKHDACLALALLPLQIKGFGHVKNAAISNAELARKGIMEKLIKDHDQEKQTAAE